MDLDFDIETQLLLQKLYSHVSKGTCRFLIALFLFFLCQALYGGLRGGDVYVYKF